HLVGEKPDLVNQAEKTYVNQFTTLLGNEPTQQIASRLSVNRHDVQDKEIDGYWVSLCAAVTQHKLDQFVNGKSYYIRADIEKELVVPGGKRQEEAFSIGSKALIDATAADLEQGYQYDSLSPDYDRTRKVELTLNAQVDGLMQGARNTEVLIASSQQLDRLLKASDDTLGIPDPRRRYTRNYFDCTSVYRDSFIAGYTLGLLDRGDIADPNVISSLRISIRSIQDDTLRSRLIQQLEAQSTLMSNDQRLALALSLERRSLVDDEQAYDNAMNEVLEAESQIIKEGVRDEIFSNLDAVVTGRPERLALASRDMENISDAREYRDKLLGGMAVRSATYHLIDILVNLEQKLPVTDGRNPITWQDASTVIEAISSNGGISREYRIDNLLKGDTLNPDQKRLVAMLRAAHLFTYLDGGNAHTDVLALNRFYEQGYLSAQDILNVHNATLIAVDGVNRAHMQAQPEVSPPLVFRSSIEGLSELKDTQRLGVRPYANPERIGPFKDVQIFEADFRISNDYNDTKAPYYFVGRGDANKSPVKTYAPNIDVRGFKDLHTGVLAEANQVFAQTTEYIDLLAAQRFSQVSLSDIQQMIPYQDETVSQLRDQLRGKDRNQVLAFARSFEWGSTAGEVNQAIEEIESAFGDNSQLANLQRQLHVDVTLCNSEVARLDDLDKPEESARGGFLKRLFGGGGRNVDAKEAAQVKATVVAAISATGFTLSQEQNGIISDLDLRKESDRSTLRNVLISIAQESAKAVAAELTGITELIGKIPDLPDVAAKTSTKETGYVDVPLTPSPISPGSSALFKKVPVLYLTPKNIYTHRFALNLAQEMFLAAEIMAPLHALADTLTDSATVGADRSIPATSIEELQEAAKGINELTNSLKLALQGNNPDVNRYQVALKTLWTAVR
ncbi:hypothetical protein KC622_02595, partial [Candidatus Dojkabacteria bacterium]|nr:hypothetical protein [Candidatus Dojkabacteria bacterium]